ncbi:hypothetical protein ACWKX9_03795 [Enterobacter asburiae]
MSEKNALSDWRKFALDWKTLKGRTHNNAFLPLPFRQGDKTDKKQFWVFSENEYLRISVDQNINDTPEKESLDKDIKPELLLTRSLG